MIEKGAKKKKGRKGKRNLLLTRQFVLIGFLSLLGQLFGRLFLPHQRVIRLLLRLCFRRFFFLLDVILPLQTRTTSKKKKIRKSRIGEETINSKHYWMKHDLALLFITIYLLHFQNKRISMSFFSLPLFFLGEKRTKVRRSSIPQDRLRL